MPPWTDLQIPDSDFDIGALHSAIDEQRTKRKMSWKSVAREVNRSGRAVRYTPDQPLNNERPEEQTLGSRGRRGATNAPVAGSLAREFRARASGRCAPRRAAT